MANPATLTAAQIKKAAPPKDASKTRLPAGPNMHLLVRRSPSGAIQRYWQFVYTRGGTTRTMGLGSADGSAGVGFREARDKADDLLRTIRNGADPVAEKQAKRKAEVEAEKQTAAQAVTFAEACEYHIDQHKLGWKNAVHHAQWVSTLETYCKPIARKPVGAITTEDVLSVLQPIWLAKHETAARLRGRIQAVLDTAKVKNWREDVPNPARWEGHLAAILTTKAKRRVKHHAALPWRDVPAFMADLAEVEGIAARALAFTVLTAVRTGEAIEARWSEIAGDVWIIPAERTKTGKQHRVPLSAQALAVLGTLPDAGKVSGFIFPGDIEDWPITNMAMLMCLRRLKGKQAATVHGFRSSFRDWCADSGVPRELAEACLAHVAGGVERAYYRSDVIDLRRDLMQRWADHCLPAAGVGANVVPLVPR